VVDIKRVGCPILILQGADDVQISPRDLPRLVDAAKAANWDVTAHVFPNDNHLFMAISANEPRSPAAALAQYLSVPDRIDAKVMHTLLRWLRAKG